MTVSFPISPEENPRERLRRLLKSEEEKQGKGEPGPESPEDETAETGEVEEKDELKEKKENLEPAPPTETPPSQVPRNWSPDTQDQPVAKEGPAHPAIPLASEETPPSTSSRASPPPPPPLGETPRTPPPALGTMGMPLPPRSDESEINAAQPDKTSPPGQPAGSSQPRSITNIPSTDNTPRQTTPKKPVSGSHPVQPPAGKTPPTYVYPTTPASRTQAQTRKQSQTTGYQRPAPERIQPASNQPYPPTSYPPQAYMDSIPPGKSRANIRKGLGCAARMVILGIFGLTVICLCLASFMIYEYYTISQKLPPVDNLREKTSTFETTYIRDRNGNLLYEVLDPTAGRRTYVTLDKISPYLLAAVIATEDKNYYTHGGFDPLAILRAFWQNISSGETVSGASTITQQLVRMLFLSADERSQRTYIRKVREALLAAEVTRRYSKDEILELYLNEIYFGNMAYGIEAAAQTYFGISANQLTLGQAAFLAGLPQAPALYDVYTNRAAALERQRQILQLIWNLAQERGGCITVYISGNSQDVCINAETLRAAYDQIQNYQFQTPEIQMLFPHWVIYIIQQLEAQYGSDTIYRSGFNVYTTIDPTLQEAAEKLVKQQVATLTANHATDGALVAINPINGEILAMVGSADFNDKVNSGEVNMAINTRQPGSAIKPVNYLAAFEKGWTPATLIWDVPTSFTPSGDPNDPVGLTYTPTNYDGRFHGPVTVRTALANSYNIPAVKTLQFVGIYTDPNNPGQGGMIAMAKRLGIDSLTAQDYGLALTLGGGEVSLLELTGAYAVIANGGVKVPLVSITRILDHTGNVVYEYKQPQGAQVIRPEHAYLISSILSDNEARAPMFGRNSPLALPFQVAAKTGTTTSFKDNWTIGYTPDLAVGVWVGNADNSPMENTTGLTGAAPIWHDFMILAIDQLKGGNPTPFYRPGDIIDRVICAISGTEPSPSCPSQRSEVFAADQPPLPASQDLWATSKVDTWTNLRASTACGNFTKDVDVINVTDTWARAWLTQNEQGRTWAKDMGFSTPLTFVPDRDCTASDPRPLLTFNSPGEGQTILTSPLDIFGQADATSNFASYRLEWGQGDKPDTWKKLDERNTPVKQVEKLYTWDLLTGNDGSAVPAGLITLRLYLQSTGNTYAELSLHVNIGVPTLTPTPSPSPTATETSTSTSIPTVTPTVTPMPTNTPVPTLTPVPTNTPLPPTPTETLTPEATTTGSTP